MNKLLLYLLPAAAVLLASCSKPEPKETEAAAPVQVAPVETGAIHRIVEADAVLFPVDQSSVTPKVSAPVRKFYVNRGDHVKAGQLLATLENRDLAAAAAAAKGQLDQAAANLRSTADAQIPEAVVKAQTDVQSAQQQFDAAQKLLQSREELLREGALARRLVDEARVQFAQAKAALDSAQEHLRALQSVGKQEQIAGARAQVESAQGQLRSAEAQVSYTEIRSPISGVVAERPTWEGEMASAGTPLMTIVDISRIVARANVPQEQALHVKLGNPATLRVVDLGFDLPGKVTVVSPATDPQSTTVQVWVQADNPGERLKPGMAARVSIVTETIPNAVLVPAAALLPASEGGTSIMTVTPDGVAHERQVTLGVREGDKVQIVSGVAPGDQVVVVGGVGLQDKAKVHIVKPGENPGAEKPE